MKFVYRGIIIALALAAIATHAASAATLTLDDAINLALKNRAAIISARGSEELARAGRQAALGAFLPRIDASYQWNKIKPGDQTINQLEPTRADTSITTTIIGADTARDVVVRPRNFQLRESTLSGEDRTTKGYDVGASLSLLDLGNFFNYASAKASVEAARLDVINSEQDLIYAVKTSYFAYLAAVQNVGVQEDAVKRSEEQLKLIQSRFELGSAAKSDVLKQQVQYGNDQLSLLQARNGVITSLAALAYTVGIDPREDTGFSPDFTNREYNGSLQEALDYGMQHEPSILTAEADVRSARNDVRSARSEYLPKLGATASYGNSKTEFLVGDQSSSSLSYGFRATWNIFDGFLREQRITSAKVARNNTEARLADTRNLVASQIKSAYLEIEQLKEQKRVSQENVDAATEDLKITQEKYNLGAATILDLLNAQVSLKQAQVSLIRADFDLNLAVANLENAMGKM